jgi:ubiquinone/menaquinone biosynthesis C-methylase UbiE
MLARSVIFKKSAGLRIGGAGMQASEEYFLGHSPVEQRRLQQQAQELAQESTWLFDQIGIGPGSRVVEIGCGPQGCLELLSDRVGPGGFVIGVELSEHAVETARRFLADRGRTNAEVRQGHGASTGLEAQSFDFATARLVLVNVPEPEKIVAEMVALVKPGGVVALHEADWIAHLCDPALPEWDRLMQALVTYSKENGIDLYIGRRIARMLRAAGLTDIRLNPLVHVYEPDHSRRPIFLQFVHNLRDRIVERGLLSEPEFAECYSSLERHISDPNTFVMSHIFVQAWGRK